MFIFVLSEIQIHWKYFVSQQYHCTSCKRFGCCFTSLGAAFSVQNASSLGANLFCKSFSSETKPWYEIVSNTGYQRSINCILTKILFYQVPRSPDGSKLSRTDPDTHVPNHWQLWRAQYHGQGWKWAAEKYRIGENSGRATGERTLRV